MFVIVCFGLLYMTIGETQNRGTFLKDLNSYQNTCREMGWEPMCQRKHVKNRAVAFHAYLKHAINGLSQKQIIRYDHVVTNIGGGYNTTTGKFTAPVDGIYSFSWTYLTAKGAVCYIGGMVDGRQLVWSAIHNQLATWQSTTGHLVIRMKKGSKFWTQSFSNNVHLHDHFTFLTGYRIFGDK